CDLSAPPVAPSCSVCRPRHPPAPPPSPTRRSSDLLRQGAAARLGGAIGEPLADFRLADRFGDICIDLARQRGRRFRRRRHGEPRSEEHTAELQSLTNPVCPLLLSQKPLHTQPLLSL